MATIALVPIAPVFTNAERLAVAGYSGLAREAYELGLRLYASWCQQQRLHLFQARRADIECFARDLESRSCARAPSPGGCAPSPGSTATPSKRHSLSAPRQRPPSPPGLRVTRERAGPERGGPPATAQLRQLRKQRPPGLSTAGGPKTSRTRARRVPGGLIRLARRPWQHANGVAGHKPPAA